MRELAKPTTAGIAPTVCQQADVRARCHPASANTDGQGDGRRRSDANLGQTKGIRQWLGQDDRNRHDPSRVGVAGRTDAGAADRARRLGRELAAGTERDVPLGFRGLRQRRRRHRPQEQRVCQAQPADRQHRHAQTPPARQEAVGSSGLGSDRVRRGPPSDGLSNGESRHQDTEFQVGRGAARTQPGSGVAG